MYERRKWVGISAQETNRDTFSKHKQETEKEWRLPGILVHGLSKSEPDVWPLVDFALTMTDSQGASQTIQGVKYTSSLATSVTFRVEASAFLRPCETDNMAPCETDNMAPCETDNMAPCETDNMAPCEMDNMTPCETDNMAPCETDNMTPCHI
ncbi:hypothetical protein RRG08_051018 [Elysia crispata]|uniref:Uncharacterized protein n=1 Tax=Elysia crispata TaxID=231223 RepID=A0AAE0Z578_9GAST|nr:hypothetical protein RRG08_051018 [Elysia crispata]